ncbi:uncharacterized protein K489DRAFT_367608 [Dissoconium aciculare CBS 342.82]|uniref:Uncharacterized protein n=1 Tax=Dissoconium aciculare CBS 342.82 TaxID=1314786 RepID=A0A6J3MEG0_9PEZI|nr:uncharacterized protein K489DRAFT_367608 [Dissoconium aciculare CBS 342.82]KAF1826390.1 hypothetical protein K489DRAFT_367608 [Dissoconium aciculare CBS 342.82]
MSSQSSKPTVPVADSWEDDVEDNLEADSKGNRLKQPVATTARPCSGARQTAISGSTTRPLFNPDGSLNDGTAPLESAKTSSNSEERRPDKTTAIASRLIAAAIGQRPAQRTKEQREYDQAMKIQEKKKRDQAKERELQAQREKEKAKQDIWGD